MNTTLELSILELGHLEVALEAYIEDAVDSHARAHSMGADAEELAELEVIVEEGQDLLDRIKAALKR